MYFLKSVAALFTCWACFLCPALAKVATDKPLVVSTPARCLAANIYHEARGESVKGQYAVALVTLNRAKQRKAQVCREVFKPTQFSWTNRYVQHVKNGWKLSPKLKPNDDAAWKVANKIAAKTLAGKVKDFTNGSKFYHTSAVHPKWDKAMKRVAVIGKHEFFVQVASN